MEMKRRMQADGKEAWTHQISWEADIQAETKSDIVINISYIDIAHLGRRNEG